MATAELRDSLDQLPADQRRALLLAALFGFTAREIGEIERIPLGTAKTRIRTAMLKLAATETDDDPASPRPRRGTRDERAIRRLRTAASDGGRDRARDRRRRRPRLGARPPRRLPGCRAAVERLSALADELLMLAPRSSRRPGFEARVAGRDRASARKPRLRQRLALPAIAAGARPPAPRPRSGSRSATTASSPTPTATTLAVANGEYFDADAVELPGGEKVGYVYGYQGRTSWVLAVIYDGVATTAATSSRGSPPTAAESPISPLEIARRARQRRRATPVDYDELTEIRLLDDAGREVADSDLTQLSPAEQRGLRPASGGYGSRHVNCLDHRHRHRRRSSSSRWSRRCFRRRNAERELEQQRLSGEAAAHREQADSNVARAQTTGREADEHRRQAEHHAAEAEHHAAGRDASTPSRPPSSRRRPARRARPPRATTRRPPSARTSSSARSRRCHVRTAE